MAETAEMISSAYLAAAAASRSDWGFGKCSPPPPARRRLSGETSDGLLTIDVVMHP